MTDWNGGSSTPWKSMHAGNDLIMPGGKGRAMNILQAVRTVMPEFDERGQVIMVQEVPLHRFSQPAGIPLRLIRKDRIQSWHLWVKDILPR